MDGMDDRLVYPKKTLVFLFGCFKSTLSGVHLGYQRVTYTGYNPNCLSIGPFIGVITSFKRKWGLTLYGSPMSLPKKNLGGGFEDFFWGGIFTTKVGVSWFPSWLDTYFSNGLVQPPTSFFWVSVRVSTFGPPTSMEGFQGLNPQNMGEITHPKHGGNCPFC